MPERGPPPPPPVDLMRTRLGWGMFVGWWSVLALFFAAQLRIGSAMRGTPRGWGEALLIGSIDAYTWALLALAAFWLARRLPLDAVPLARLLAVHLAAAMVLVVTRLEFFSFIGPRILPGAPTHSLTALERLVYAVPTNLLIYTLLVGVGYTLEYFRRYRDRELAAARLEARLADAQLQALTAQLQPRFLFTALRTISALMHRDRRAADRTLALLGDLLRMTLQQGERQEVTLRDELELLELYVEIEQARFDERLHVTWHVDPEALDARVPHLILQPLIENALGRAIAAGTEPGRVEILARCADGSLRLEVREWGAAAGAADEEEVGVSNARVRLARRYGDRHRLELEELPGGGTVARIEVPFERWSPEAEEAEHGELAASTATPA